MRDYFGKPLATTSRQPAVFRNFVSRLSQTFFWISKWLVAAVVLAGLLLFGIVYLLRQGIDLDTFLNYFALGLLVFVVVTLFYGIIAIHDVPYEIAKKRDHPHQDAIHAAGWVSLFTLHALWPFLWIWAMLYRPDRGWGMQQAQGSEASSEQTDRLEELFSRVQALERQLKTQHPREHIKLTDEPRPLKARPTPQEVELVEAASEKK
jgi:hypothetical protein